MISGYGVFGEYPIDAREYSTSLNAEVRSGRIDATLTLAQTLA
jgi:hypothetical protein